MSRHRVRLAIGIAASVVAFTPALSAQHTGSVASPKAKPESATVVAGKHYQAGKFHRWFLGDNYRDLWTTPIRVPVFDWHSFAGGLHPTKEGGGNQTKSLRFETAEGDEYVFRLVDKTVRAPEQLKGTPVAWLIQDVAVSAQHPGGGEVTARLVKATGVLHPTPMLVVMPDDSALGKFHDDFAGKLGMVEEYPHVPDKGPGFAGATKIIDSEELMKLLSTNAKEHIDTRKFLTARLTDFLINDNDRHQGNWKWARLSSGAKDEWEPIARDRDHAFVSFGGVLIGLGRRAASALVSFGDRPNVAALMAPSGFDDRLLAGLEKPVWDSVTRAFQTRISDSVIDDAVRAMPAGYQSSAAQLASRLKARRAAIPKAADEFYRILAKRVAIHGSDSADRATITRREDGFVDVRLESEGKEFFSRRFDPRETVELLVYLHGGDDTAIVTGRAPSSILVRIIGGNGTNDLVDSSTVGGRAHPTRLYDMGKVTGISYGKDTSFDRRPWEYVHDSLLPHRLDAGGSFAPIAGLNEHRGLGLTPRLGMSKYSYGFSKRPYSTMIAVEGEYATSFHAGRASVTADKRLELSPLHFTMFARMSDFEILSFGGLGNATMRSGGSADFFDARQRQWLVRPTVALAIGEKLDVSLGPEIQRSSTDSTPNRFLSANRPYGFGTVNQAGLRLDATYKLFAAPDSEASEHTHHRAVVEASARYFPAMLDLRSAFEEAAVTASAASTLPLPTRPLFVVRAGARKVFGDFPFYEAATIGGEGTTRYMDTQRYAGDAALFATSELRVPLAHVKLIVPLRAGVLGLAEAGRVYLDGDSPGGWHSRTGGGIWLGRGDAPSVITLTSTTEPGRSGVHLRFGLNF
jgi:hypothetical protein